MDDAEKVAAQVGAKGLFITSAKTNQGVDEVSMHESL
jgi:ethanolamine utilization protein EutP (predicted NTPase)